jgi:transglutaminase-like putative cysteine protease
MTLSVDALKTQRAWWLLAALLLGAAPHTLHVPLWVTSLVLALFGWRAYLLQTRRSLPRKWLLLLIAGAATVGIFVSYGRIMGRDSGVTLLLVMLALKLLEMKTLRDAMVLIFIGYFLVITNFLYSQTIPMAVYLCCVVWLVTTTMIGLQFRGAQPSYRPLLRMAGVMLLQAIPMMLVLFVLFPRVQGPLWGMPQDAFASVTGLSEEMTPGSISSLLASDATAFRVNFKNEVPASKQLYWRGPVMWDFDGQTWKASRNPSLMPRRYEGNGTPVEYTVTVEPNGKRWLFALDLPAMIPPKSFMSADYQLLSPGGVMARTRYDMASYLNFSDHAELRPYDRQRALQLPDNFNPRSTKLAHNMRAAAPTARDYVAAVLNMFRQENFRYTTTPPRLGVNSVDEFLFSTRAGFCEHYASAFAVMMRAAGIPARIVTGYQGGELNNVGDYMIVRQADAHAWTEVWLEDAGWVRIDPTGAVSPARVEAGVAAAVPQGEALPLLMRGEYPWLHRARLTWDSVANSWNQAVLGYTQERQRQLMQRAGLDNVTWQNLTLLLFFSAGVITLGLALLMLRKRHMARVDPVTTAYSRFCARLARRGIERHPSEGPEAFRQRALAARPELANAIDTISTLYIRLRYGNSGNPHDLLELKRSVKLFKA